MISNHRFTVALITTAMFGMSSLAAAEEAARPSDWHFKLSALALKRSTPSDGAIMAANPGSTPFMTGSDFDFGIESGIDAAIGYKVNENTSIEARFMRSEMETSHGFTTPGGFIGVGFVGPGGTAVVSEYETQFQSGEINWRHHYSDRVTVLAGLRGMDVSDTLRTVLNANVATGLHEAENSLLGVQIGAQTALRDTSDPFQLDLLGKVGVFANRSNAGIREFVGNNFVGEFQSERKTKTNYAVELGLMASYRLSSKTLLTAGYQLLWMNNLALASNAASESLLNPTLLRDNIYRDDLLLHGLNIGLQVSF